MLGCRKLLIVLLTERTIVRMCCEYLLLYVFCFCCYFKFSRTAFTWLSVFSSSTQLTRVTFFCFRLSISSGAHNHALSWSFLIACKIWFYCWCGVAEDIMFICALAICFLLFYTAEKYPQNRQCRAAQFTVLPKLVEVDASSVETWWKAFAVNGPSGMDKNGV